MSVQKDISLVIVGEAGQGINTVAEIVSSVSLSTGLNVFCTTEYMSRIRGGMNSTEIRISNERIIAPVKRIDFLLSLTRGGVKHLEERISDNTVVIGEEKTDRGHSYFINFKELTKELGNPIFINVIVAGIVVKLLNIELIVLEEHLRKLFRTKGETLIEKNINAARIGYQIAKEHNIVTPSVQLKADPALKDERLMDGSEAIALGAIAGGCDFIAAYPMTPSSGVWTYLAQHAREFHIITEQAEDEISAMNMGIGASYAGARVMVTTSGGGFDLMTEGLSLLAAQENPMVIHLAQRPGPATGLPTRTEQADLELALYAGHGEFPRVILAPGTLEQCFFLTAQAFNFTDKYQVPVFVLTDQFIIDSFYNVPVFNGSEIKIESHIVKTDPAYKRYLITENGISPRGIPDLGQGLVNADCHVHDENGHITENLRIRDLMVQKFLRKAETVKSATITPYFYGSKDYKKLVICWGSNYGVVKEALSAINDKELALLHFSQVFPIHKTIFDYLKQAQHTIIVENNATGQFAKLIKLVTGYEIKQKILKYNGLPFFVEEIIAGIEEGKKDEENK